MPSAYINIMIPLRMEEMLDEYLKKEIHEYYFRTVYNYFIID